MIHIMIPRNIFVTTFFLAATFIICVQVAGQTRIGTVQGRVKDPAGAVIFGASVTIRQAATDYFQSARTDAQGFFRFVNVPFNTYVVRVQSEGFNTAEQSVALDSNVPLNLDFLMPPDFVGR